MSATAFERRDHPTRLADQDQSAAQLVRDRCATATYCFYPNHPNQQHEYSVNNPTILSPCEEEVFVVAILFVPIRQIRIKPYVAMVKGSFTRMARRSNSHPRRHIF